jgi:phosphoribosylanthranilate isomerase
MSLKTLVKVGSITNLSDARYCAGMGVDWLGFTVVEGQDRYISPKQFQDIRGWVSGPKIVAQIYGIPSADALTGILEQYQPDLLELGMNDLKKFTLPLALPFILSVPSAEAINDIDGPKPQYLLVDTLGEVYNDSIPILVTVHSADDAEKVIQRTEVKGIALQGGQEIRPGLKTYDEMGDILEMLEVD